MIEEMYKEAKEKEVAGGGGESPGRGPDSSELPRLLESGQRSRDEEEESGDDGKGTCVFASSAFENYLHRNTSIWQVKAQGVLINGDVGCLVSRKALASSLLLLSMRQFLPIIAWIDLTSNSGRHPRFRKS